MSATLIRTRIFKKVYEDDVSLNIKPGTTRRHLGLLAQSTVLSSFENLSLLSPSPSHEKDLVSAAENTRITFEQAPDAAASKLSASISHFERRLEALTKESTITAKRIEQQEVVIQLLKDDNAHLKNDIRRQEVVIQLLKDDNAHFKNDIRHLTSDHTRLKKDIQKLNDRIHPLTCIALRVFLDAFLAVKGYNTNNCGSRKAWISQNIKHLLPNTGISMARFEHLLK